MECEKEALMLSKLMVGERNFSGFDDVCDDNGLGRSSTGCSAVSC